MKKISLFSFLAAALLCVGGGQNAMAQTVTYSYNVTEAVTAKTETTATGGTIVFGADKFETPKNFTQLGYKLDGDYKNGNTKYVLIKPSVAITAGDVIKIGCGCTGSAGSAGIALFANMDGSATAFGTYTISETKKVLESSYTVQANDPIVGKNEFYICRNGASAYFFSISITAAPIAKDDATLKAIMVDGIDLEGFDAATTEYNVELPFGTATVPEVSATATSDKANVAITQATSATGTATIVVTAEDGTTTKTYTIHFTIAASVSTDATLKSLSIDGNAVAGFRADSLDYKYEIAYTAALPVISAEVNDAAATMEITQVTEAPGTATVIVTAQDGTTKITYTIDITRHAAIKHLTVVPFSNGVKGAIDETALTITVPYLAGTDEPTIDATGITASGDGTPTYALSEDEKTITLTGIDNVSTKYTIVFQPLAAQELGTEEITFDGQETYIYGAYGWDASKGWKFSKNVDEEGNMRNAKGNTRIYMALSPAESVNLISSPNVSSARKINVYVNGVLFEKETPKNGGVITLTLTTEANNFIIIESNQTGGDGGFTAMQLTNPKTPTSFEQVAVSEKAVKVVRDGQLYILRDGKTYTAQGIVVE